MYTHHLPANLSILLLVNIKLHCTINIVLLVSPVHEHLNIPSPNCT